MRIGNRCDSDITNDVKSIRAEAKIETKISTPKKQFPQICFRTWYKMRSHLISREWYTGRQKSSLSSLVA